MPGRDRRGVRNHDYGLPGKIIDDFNRWFLRLARCRTSIFKRGWPGGHPLRRGGREAGFDEAGGSRRMWSGRYANSRGLKRTDVLFVQRRNNPRVGGFPWTISQHGDQYVDKKNVRSFTLRSNCPEFGRVGTGRRRWWWSRRSGRWWRRWRSSGAAGGASGAGGAAGTTGGATTGAPNAGTTSGSGVNSNATGQRPGGNTTNSRDNINNQDRNPPR